MCGSIHVWIQNLFGPHICILCHFNEHRVISTIKTLLVFQDWLTLILHVGVQSKYFVKHLLISKQQRGNEKTYFI